MASASPSTARWALGDAREIEKWDRRTLDCASRANAGGHLHQVHGTGDSGAGGRERVRRFPWTWETLALPNARTSLLTDVYSIWLREMTRYVRARSRVVISFVQPMAWLIIFGVGFSASLGSSVQFAASTGTTNYLDFLVPGFWQFLTVLPRPQG